MRTETLLVMVASALGGANAQASGSASNPFILNALPNGGRFDFGFLTTQPIAGSTNQRIAVLAPENNFREASSVFIDSQGVINVAATNTSTTFIPLELVQGSGSVSGVPAGFNTVAVDLGRKGTTGFFVSQANDLIFSHDTGFGSFALCNDLLINGDAALLWTAAGTNIPKHANCFSLQFSVEGR